MGGAYERKVPGSNLARKNSSFLKWKHLTQLGQGKWDSTQWDKETGPKDSWIQHSWDRETRPKDHIWDSTPWDKETGPKDHRIQHSWDRETRPKDHIWAKTIYGIQHRGTRRPDPKTIGFNTVGTGKPDPKTIYGQRPYMGFNTVGQGDRTQRP